MKWGDGANNVLFTYNMTLEYQEIKSSIIGLHKFFSIILLWVNVVNFMSNFTSYTNLILNVFLGFLGIIFSLF
jgi:hypothetical protein